MFVLKFMWTVQIRSLFITDLNNEKKVKYTFQQFLFLFCVRTLGRKQVYKTVDVIYTLSNGENFYNFHAKRYRNRDIFRVIKYVILHWRCATHTVFFLHSNHHAAFPFPYSKAWWLFHTCRIIRFFRSEIMLSLLLFST